MGGDGQDIEVGDAVDVPGGMHGVVKFIGSVRGKKGVFAGVELDREFAARGKNDGDVDGYATFLSRAQEDSGVGY
jgi:dynactin complex subunit